MGGCGTPLAGHPRGGKAMTLPLTIMTTNYSVVDLRYKLSLLNFTIFMSITIGN